MARKQQPSKLQKHSGAERAAAPLMLLVALAALVACGNNTLYLSTLPSGPLHPGQTFQFAASLGGNQSPAGLVWSVQPGEAATTGAGSITQNGLYTAPSAIDAPTTVTVQVALKSDPRSSSSMLIQLLPAASADIPQPSPPASPTPQGPGSSAPTPEITASSANIIFPGPLNFAIAGLNFLPQTTASLNGSPAVFTYTSTTSATITGTVPPGTSEVSLILQNPSEQSASAPFVIPVEQPELESPLTAEPLTGCNNPNTGAATGDWGVDVGDQVFYDPNSVDVNYEPPTYSSNTIFWISRETEPGQSVLMAGAFTNAAKTVKVARIPPGTLDWEGFVQQNGTGVKATQQGTSGLSFIVPVSFSSGVYGFEINDPSAAPTFGLANLPFATWAVGVPSAANDYEALQHQVHDCGAEPGETLRIFGKNFATTSQMILQSSGGGLSILSPSSVDATSMAVVVPAELSPGVYNMWVGNYPWDAASGPVSQVVVYAAPSLGVTQVTCSTLVGDGITDNTASLQRCLDDAAPPPGSKRLVDITIPEGSFAIAGSISPHPFEIVAGQSSQSTHLIGRPTGAAPKSWFILPQYFGMEHLSFEAPANPYLFMNNPTSNPLLAGHLYFEDINIQSTSDESNGGEVLFSLHGPDIQVYNSRFLSNSNQDFDIWYGDGAIISESDFVLNNWTGLGFADSQNVIFEHNTVHSQNQPDGTDITAGSGLAIGRGNSLFGPSSLSQDIYIGYNTFASMGAEPQQVITTDGDGGAYFGLVSSSTSDTVLLADDPWWGWMGTTNPEASIISIIGGTGVGQYSPVKSYDGRSISLVSPWKVPPDSTSVVAITQYELNLTIAHNSFVNTFGSLSLSDSFEGVIEDNQMTGMQPGGSAIYVAAFGPYGSAAGYGPVMNTDVLRNSGVPNLVIFDNPGCLLSGLLIRDNVVPTPGYISNTNGVNGMTANLVEQNQANWLPTWWTIPGLLIQDDTPPPQ